ATTAANELLFAGMGLPASFTGTASAGTGYVLQRQDTLASRAITETGVAATFVSASSPPPPTTSSTSTTAPSTTITTSSSTTTTTMPAGGGIALRQSSAVEGTGIGSLSVAFPSANAPGDLIIAFVRMSTTTQTVGITDA